MTRIFALIIIVIAAVTVGSPLVAQTDTVFTYQGELKENSGHANGFYNLDFSLWDSLAGGSQIGSELMFNDLPVVDGRFTVELDFGASAFDNSSRWLEISVNGTELSPRNLLTRAPYAIQTRGIFVDEQNNVGIGTDEPTSVLHIDGEGSAAAALFIHAPGIAFGDLVVGSPAGEVGIIGIANNGNRRDIRFTDAGLALYTSNSPASPIAGNGLVINESGHVGIGTSTPTAALEINSSQNKGIIVETAGSFVNGDGVLARVEGNDAYAIVGVDGSGTGLAGHFAGDVNITGTLSKSGGSFKIDHPLDPTNKFLSHSFVESPDMMNIYNGNAILDGSGRATITLPDWFEALNREFRYQLTCIGGFATVYVESEIENNQFTIAGGNAGLKVSWQVTGVRQDAWAEANRIPVEEQKVGYEAGYYLHPEVYDLDRSMSILSARDAHRSVRESEAATNEFQEEKQIEATASRPIYE